MLALFLLFSKQTIFMEQLLKDFGNLLGIQNLYCPSGKLLRLNIENIGDLDLLHNEGRCLMRATKLIPWLNKDTLLNLLAATHYRHLSIKPIRPWVQRPDRVGYGIIFSEDEVTPDRLYQNLELLTKELEKISA
ncbi:MAG: hypothetical protein C5B47_00350 [Verrucomicrobia bacterium]|nr:MAG: hypothetical protein C5B47_00350 [Verrucomicrobiota bacterium]